MVGKDNTKALVKGISLGNQEIWMIGTIHRMYERPLGIYQRKHWAGPYTQQPLDSDIMTEEEHRE